MSQEQSTSSVETAQAVANSAQAAVVNAQTSPTKPAAVNANTVVSNVDQLQAKEPKLFKMISDAIAQNICDELKKHADRMKELYRDNAKA